MYVYHHSNHVYYFIIYTIILSFTGSVDLLEKFSLKDLPDNVLPTGDDYDNPAYIMSPRGSHKLPGKSAFSNELTNEFSILTKFRLDNVPHKFTLLNISSDSGEVDLAISVDADKKGSITLECSSVIATFELDNLQLKEKVYYKMSIMISKSRIVLLINNKIVGEGLLEDAEACQFRLQEKSLYIMQHIKHPVSSYTIVTIHTICTRC